MLDVPVFLRISSGADDRLGREVASHLNIPIVTEPADDASLCLVLTDDGLSLVRGALSLRGDFSDLLPRIRPNALNAEMIVKAVRFRTGFHSPTVLDATAGLGEDAFLLAASGQQVTMYESDPVIAALLRDALRRAESDPALAPAVCRMELIEGDSIAAMRALKVPPSVVYLDPMFPERSKSGLIKKKFQLLHELEQPCADEEALLFAAIAARPARIVVKRPSKAPPLAGRTPSFVLAGSTIRFDCYTL